MGWDHTDPWVVEQEDQVVMNHQGGHPEGHPQEARLAARLEMAVMAEMMIPWERESRHMEVGCRMLDIELPLSLWTLGLED